MWRTILESFLRDFHPTKVHCRCLESGGRKGKNRSGKIFPGLALSLFTKTVRKPFCIQPT